MSTNSAATANPQGRPSTLGVLWVVYALLRFAAVILLVLFSGTATVMFGALLARVADPYILMTTFHVIYVCAVIVTALSGVIGFFAGLALLSAKSSARSLALVASILSLSDLPFGTTLGIYTLVLFLP